MWLVDTVLLQSNTLLNSTKYTLQFFIVLLLPVSKVHIFSAAPRSQYKYQLLSTHTKDAKRNSTFILIFFWSQRADSVCNIPKSGCVTMNVDIPLSNSMKRIRHHYWRLSVIYGTRKYISLNNSTHVHILLKKNPVHVPPYFFLKSFSILSAQFQAALFFQIFLPQPHKLSSPPPWTSHASPNWRSLSKQVTFGEECIS